MFSPQGQPDQEVGDLGVLQTVSATCIYYFFSPHQMAAVLPGIVEPISP